MTGSREITPSMMKKMHWVNPNSSLNQVRGVDAATENSPTGLPPACAKTKKHKVRREAAS